MQQDTKRCVVCGVEKPLDEFHRRRSVMNGQGRASRCAACARAQTREWKKRNAERVAEYQRAWEAEHAEQRRACAREYREKNRDHRLVVMRAYGRNNREAVSERKRAWSQANRELYARHNRLRNALKATWDAEDREYIEILRGDPCSYCGGPVESLDHIVPVALEGDFDWTNLTGACRSCNASKGADPLLMFMRRRSLDSDYSCCATHPIEHKETQNGR